MQTLKTKKEFDFVYKNGFRRYGNGFVIYIFKQKGNEKFPFCYGLSVSKKIGKAVSRNLIKRRFRAMFLSFASILENYKMVVVAKDGILNESYNDLKNSICNAILFALTRIDSRLSLVFKKSLDSGFKQ